MIFKMNILTSLLESIYIWFMFTQFKTNYYISHPFDSITSNIPFIHHDTSSNYQRKICPLGVMFGWLAPIWFLGRLYLPIQKIKEVNKIIILIISIIAFLTNFNAFIYFIPIIILTYCIY